MTETTWDYAIQDFSPLIEYTGLQSNDSNLNPAWEQNCSVQLLTSSNRLCDVSSVHMTTFSNATVSLTFYGTFP